MRGQEKNLLAKKCSGVGMKINKWEVCFIEDHISRDVNPASRNIKAFDAFVLSTVPDKDTLLGAKHEHSIIIWSKSWLTCATKDTKGVVIWFCMEEFFSGSVIVEDSTWQYIDEMHGSEKSFIPKFKWHGGSCEKCKSYFYYMHVLAFSGPILLMSMRT